MSDESAASLTLHFNRQNQRQYIRVEDVRPRDYVTTQDKEKEKVRNIEVVSVLISLICVIVVTDSFLVRFDVWWHNHRPHLLWAQYDWTKVLWVRYTIIFLSEKFSSFNSHSGKSYCKSLKCWSNEMTSKTSIFKRMEHRLIPISKDCMHSCKNMIFESIFFS